MLQFLFGNEGPDGAARTQEETDAAIAQLLYIFELDNDDGEESD